MSATGQGWFNVQQAATYTGLSREVIRVAIKTHKLIAYYPTSRPSISKSDLDAWIQDSPTEKPEAKAS